MSHSSPVAVRCLRLLPRTLIRAAACVVLVLPSYALLAYVLLPASWHYYQKSREIDSYAVTYTAETIPADPMNVALVGSREQVVAAMRQAGWLPADPITFRSGWRDAGSVLFNQSYPTAPMSTQYVGGRPQDLAFERQVGKSPRQRHHVRFWKADDPVKDGQALWIGAASFDDYVGVSRYTGEVMHHIHPAVDREREQLLRDLEAAGAVATVRRLENFRPDGEGFNGGGDRYFTDGALGIAVLRPLG